VVCHIVLFGLRFFVESLRLAPLLPVTARQGWPTIEGDRGRNVMGTSAMTPPVPAIGRMVSFYFNQARFWRSLRMRGQRQAPKQSGTFFLCLVRSQEGGGGGTNFFSIDPDGRQRKRPMGERNRGRVIRSAATPVAWPGRALGRGPEKRTR
jgi:hypothetical protein